MYKFYLNDQQIIKFEKWKKTLPKTPPTAIGGAYTFSFIPTSIGISTWVRYYNGEELDLTEYESW